MEDKKKLAQELNDDDLENAAGGAAGLGRGGTTGSSRGGSTGGSTGGTTGTSLSESELAKQNNDN